MKKIKILAVLLITQSIVTTAYATVCMGDGRIKEQYIVIIDGISNGEYKDNFIEKSLNFSAKVDVTVREVIKGNKKNIIPRNKGMLSIDETSPYFPKNFEEQQSLISSLWVIYSDSHNDKDSKVFVFNGIPFECPGHKNSSKLE
ncbi:hypothetical protein [Wohlfahrtiimonas populi]|uniref:hypothetical protein n=1 Tax=Wohlfahrtiimonas populi TaxID=1940240 RepID=UPI00098D1D32|nr:hypothetical protein [Wohlfahrtiimonas populi]